jgi:tetratricopeptide (TPR) repeat protein
VHFTRGQLDRALAVAEQNRTVAETDGGRRVRLQAHVSMWVTHYFRGDFQAALRHLDAGEPLYDPRQDRLSAVVYTHDPKADALCHRALLHWQAGRMDTALQFSDEAIRHARDLGHPASVVMTMFYAVWLRLCRREPALCRELSDALLEYMERHWTSSYYRGRALWTRGWALALEGDLTRGIADMEAGHALDTRMATFAWSAFYAEFGAAQARAGRLDEARALMERSKAVAAANGEGFHEPEIHRLDAEIVLAEAGGSSRADAPARERAELLLRSAVDSARRRGSRTLALRANTALARLCGRGDKGRQARADVADLLAGFAEGFDTPDVREARRVVSRSA